MKILFSLSLLLIYTNTLLAEEFLVSWNEAQGMERLSQSQYKDDFFLLANHFEGQINKIFCGPASATIVLNALRLREQDNRLPKDERVLADASKKYLPPNFDPYYPRYTQHTIFTSSSKTKLEVLGKPIEIQGKQQPDFGLQLHQLAELLKSHGLEVVKHSVQPDDSLDELRALFKQNLKNTDNFIIVNYNRAMLKQESGGHFSPIGAYHANSDSFLVMDVNTSTYDWVWVTAEKLKAAMATFDTVANRGYLFVSEKP